MSPERARALDLAHGLEPTPANIGRVAKDVGQDEARWAFTQWDLRRRARVKFARAEAMLFDRDGLEMATHERVAKFHADQFPSGARVADLCCGIGGDLIALARRGPAIGFEIDPARAEYARHNLRVYGLETEVVTGPADLDSLQADAVFADPQRRGEQGYGEPDPRELTNRFDKVAIKLGTAIDIELAAHELSASVLAVSFQGECRELFAVCDGTDERQIGAIHIETGNVLTSQGFPPTVDEPGAFLFHADPAAIKARCLGSLCSQEGLEALGDSDGYLTGDHPARSSWLRTYRVLWHGPGDRKHTQAALQALEARMTEVKTRRTPRQASQIQADYKPAGPRALTLAVWPVGKSLRHALIEPVTP